MRKAFGYGLVFVFVITCSLILFRNELSDFWLQKTIHPPYELEELSTEEYARIEQELTGLVEKETPRVALEKIQEYSEKDPKISRACHFLTHTIGHEAYKKYGDFAKALTYQSEICGSGYFHGVIEAHFLENDDPLTSAQTTCDAYKAGGFLNRECYHGIGHGVMYYTANNLPRALELCDSLKNTLGAKMCINGAFMENFNTDESKHPTVYIKTDDLFYPCSIIAENKKANCYVYAPAHYLTSHKNDYSGALRWCENAELPYRMNCTEGVGARAEWENIKNPKFIESICASNKNWQQDPCIRGMISYAITYYASLEPAKHICEELDTENKKTCERVVQESAPLFTH